MSAPGPVSSSLLHPEKSYLETSLRRSLTQKDPSREVLLRNVAAEKSYTVLAFHLESDTTQQNL